MKYILTIVTASIFLTSCGEGFFETTLELEEPPFTEQLVVNSILTNAPEDEDRALVSKTVGLNDKIETSIVNDAVVTVIWPDGSEYNLEYTGTQSAYVDHNYEGQLPDLVAGETYRIEVEALGKEVSSEVVMPPTPEILSTEYQEDGGLNEDGDEVSAFDIVIADPPNQDNYYRIGALIETAGFQDKIWISTTNALATDSYINADILIRDDQFDGEDFQLRLQFYGFEPVEGFEPEYKIVIRSITREQYEHDKLLRTYSENGDNPFASPIQISSNVDGGRGLFGIENVAIYDVE